MKIQAYGGGGGRRGENLVLIVNSKSIQYRNNPNGNVITVKPVYRRHGNSRDFFKETAKSQSKSPRKTSI